MIQLIGGKVIEMKQQTLFSGLDIQVGAYGGRSELTGEQLKERGMNRAAQNNRPILKVAKDVAIEIAESRGDRRCSMDDVQARLKQMGYSDRALGNAAGSVFRGGEWEFTGTRIKSVRPHAHANEIKVWRLKS